MRIRVIAVSAVLALGVIAPATASSADICYDISINLNGEVTEQADCIPT